MAIDDKGLPFPTTITENVQIRVYRQPKKSLTLANDAQARFEFRFDRAALFAHKPPRCGRRVKRKWTGNSSITSAKKTLIP